ncbi:MAG: protein-glutamate O-methyltransferase CheR [Fimbriimonadaceae bacterium]|nr:protein-glutamate O-methyltransferase CheR [Fimbriimonadaceae bacterium]
MEAVVFEQFRTLIYDASGIALQANKEALVAARVAKRMRRLGIDRYETYLDHVTADRSGEELVHLLDAISTNVTSFFRESTHFDLLAKLVPQWAAERGGKLRFWSAACSSGEEPYTLAMVLDRALEGRAVDWKILATDISTRVLEKAAAGVYEPARMGGITPDLRARYFSSCGGRDERLYQVVPELRQRVLFRRINLATPPFPFKNQLDAVFCRNVMIYFDAATRGRLVDEIARHLRPGGYLFVGHAESLTGLPTALRTVQPSVYCHGR